MSHVDSVYRRCVMVTSLSFSMVYKVKSALSSGFYFGSLGHLPDVLCQVGRKRVRPQPIPSIFHNPKMYYPEKYLSTLQIVYQNEESRNKKSLLIKIGREFTLKCRRDLHRKASPL